LKESALCLSYDTRGIHFLVDRIEESVKAIILAGDHAFHCFDIDVTHNWKGLAVTEFELVVDVTSAFDCANQSPPLGALSLAPDGVQLQVAMKDHHGFTDKEPLKLSKQGPEVGNGLRASFKRWAFKIGDKEKPQYIWIQSDGGGLE
jgi:hypothetical protein